MSKGSEKGNLSEEGKVVKLEGPKEAQKSFWQVLFKEAHGARLPTFGTLISNEMITLEGVSYYELELTYLQASRPLQQRIEIVGHSLVTTLEELAEKMTTFFQPYKERISKVNPPPEGVRGAEYSVAVAIERDFYCETWKEDVGVSFQLSKNLIVEARAKGSCYLVRGPGVLTAKGRFFYLDGKIVPCDPWSMSF